MRQLSSWWNLPFLLWVIGSCRKDGECRYIPCPTSCRWLLRRIWWSLDAMIPWWSMEITSPMGLRRSATGWLCGSFGHFFDVDLNHDIYIWLYMYIYIYVYIYICIYIYMYIYICIYIYVYICVFVWVFIGYGVSKTSGPQEIPPDLAIFGTTPWLSEAFGWSPYQDIISPPQSTSSAWELRKRRTWPTWTSSLWRKACSGSMRNFVGRLGLINIPSCEEKFKGARDLEIQLSMSHQLFLPWHPFSLVSWIFQCRDPGRAETSPFPSTAAWRTCRVSTKATPLRSPPPGPLWQWTG